MSRNQLIAVGTCLLLCIGLYLFTDIKKPKGENAAPMAAENATPEEHAHLEKLDIQTYLNEVNTGITDPAKKENISRLTASKSYKELVKTYREMDKPIAMAYYSVKLAETENTAQSYITAGDYNAILTQTAPDEKARNFLISNVLQCYQQAVALDSANDEYKLRLAGAYMESGGQPMQGVSILLDIVRRDSTNVPALLMLGRFGIISGQYDKAIARLEKILYLQPENSEALLLLAEAYNGQGNKPKAIEMLERCKKTVTRPDARKELDNYIQKLKQPNG